jgi:hypothetical protein
MTSASWIPLKPRYNRRTADVFNASGVVPVGPTRFVFIDNRDPLALFELQLKSDGTQRGKVKRRPIVGVAKDALSDPEGLALIEVNGAIDLVIASSLSVDAARPGSIDSHEGLVRVRYTPDGDLHAEAMEGFRDWLLTAHPALVPSAALVPDRGGLNIEGVAWDPSRGALLFGVRSPVADGQIPVLCVELDDPAMPWTTDGLRAGSQLSIRKEDLGAAQGIRDIDYDADQGAFLVLLGKSVSKGAAPFQLCAWDGTSTTVDVLETFSPPAKPEGVTTFGQSGTRRVLVVDDGGAFTALSGH